MNRIHAPRDPQTGRLVKRHGHAVHGGESKVWKLWLRMRQRCTRPKYVARGITVCERWQTFETFAADIVDSIGLRPSRAHSLDRIDNNRGYEPGNVRWATAKEQQHNTSFTKFVECHGRRWCVSELARFYGLEPTILHRRLRNGWTVERAVTTPVVPAARRLGVAGERRAA